MSNLFYPSDVNIILLSCCTPLSPCPTINGRRPCCCHGDGLSRTSDRWRGLQKDEGVVCLRGCETPTIPLESPAKCIPVTCSLCWWITAHQLLPANKSHKWVHLNNKLLINLIKVLLIPSTQHIVTYTFPVVRVRAVAVLCPAHTRPVEDTLCQTGVHG